MMDNVIKILVIDDNINYRQFFVSVIEKIYNAECVGTASSHVIALRKTSTLQPELVLLNLSMSNGFDLLHEFKQKDIAVLILYNNDLLLIKQKLNIFKLKVLGYIEKPEISDNAVSDLVNHIQSFVDTVHAKKYACFKHQSVVSNKIISKSAHQVKYELCVIGISTGGPQALDYLVPRLNENLPCPIIIVQHIPANFTESLARKLNAESRLTVLEAKGGEKLMAGYVYIAQGGKHLLIEKLHDGFYLVVNDAPPLNNCKPAIDILFNSVAQVFNGRVLAIVMTGMGKDGTEGVRALKQKRCWCVIQDKASSVVWGMPSSVYEAGLADEIVPLSQLSHRISELVF